MSADKINFNNGRETKLDNVSYKSMNMVDNNPETENINYANKAVIKFNSSQLNRLFVF